MVSRKALPMETAPSSIGVVICAYNEAENITTTIENVKWALNEINEESYQIIVIDDCSSDKTSEVVMRLNDQFVRLHRNDINKGFGGSFFVGLNLCESTYVAQIPGDNEINRMGIYSMLKNYKSVELTCTYTVNMEERSKKRRFISRVYSLLINLMFPTEMIYYNGPFVVKRDLIKSLNINTKSFAFQAQLIISALNSGAQFCEKPIWIQTLPTQKSAALSFKNIFQTIRDILVFWFKFKHLKPVSLKGQRKIIV
jgi:glycosyltransferase involved in cell wall biosynthesis